MNSLVNYGSDDDYDDSSEEKQTDWRGTSSKDKPPSAPQTDTNYEEVQMDLSEGSNDSKSENKESVSRRSRERDSRDRRDRDRDSRESRNRYEKDRRSSRETERSDRRDRRDRDRDRRRRSSSRERRRSRTPPRRNERSRSKSRDRSRKYTKRYERGNKGREEKIDQQKSVEEDKQSNPPDGNRFFMPGITGRFRDQIERRKQLWQKKDTAVDNKNGQTKKVWETTTFAQDVDGKVANKFKRLMGIKNSSEGGGQSTDGLKKQEEMFSSMEQQYEVARTATHTMRGVGLGFGSYQR